MGAGSYQVIYKGEILAGFEKQAVLREVAKILAIGTQGAGRSERPRAVHRAETGGAAGRPGGAAERAGGWVRPRPHAGRRSEGRAEYRAADL